MEDYKILHVHKNYEDKYNAVPMWAAPQISMILIDDLFRNDTLRWNPNLWSPKVALQCRKTKNLSDNIIDIDRWKHRVVENEGECALIIAKFTRKFYQ